MNQLIDKLFDELKKKHGLTKFEIEKIVDSQFKYTVDHILNGDIRYVKWKYLGKIKPSEYYANKRKKELKNEVPKEV